MQRGQEGARKCKQLRCASPALAGPLSLQVAEISRQILETITVEEAGS